MNFTKSFAQSFAQSFERVLQALATDVVNGLAESEARSRLQKNGPNLLPEPKRRPLLSIFIQQFLSPLIYLLLLAAGIAVSIGEEQDALVILAKPQSQ